ncbi:MAG: glycosyltransferase family 4 protein [Candidatus Aminicenantes bacterium]|nr:glycosyltransferase family 4 protein [Candidatus Aminicenantes bacterium]
MKIWLINSQEQIPYLNSKRRPMRMGLIAKSAIARGHSVTWWTSAFEHVSKRYVAREEKSEQICENLNVYWLSAIGYSNHVSIRRLINNLFVAYRFYIRSKDVAKPDLIVVSFPIPELAFAAVRYGKQYNIPVVVDVRDWWPDALFYSFPKWLKPLLGIATIPYEVLIGKTFKSATAITGITREFVLWGLSKAKRKITELDKDFPHGYEKEEMSRQDIREADSYWEKLGVKKEMKLYNIVFLGSITRSSNFAPIIDASLRLSNDDNHIRFIFCGSGDRLKQLKKMAKGINNIVVNGQWVDRYKIASLLNRAAIGLVPLPDRPDFLNTINNKTIEYLSYSLPIIVSPKRSLVAKIAEENNFGVSWDGYDGEQLIRCIKKVINSNTDYNKMSQAAATYFAVNYRAENVYGKYLEHIEKIEKDYRERK